ncbi:Methyltransferase domain-containing protein [Mariniphaga anaerophila]|uniref:Methyltransferase domain-containing protein n=1 Tax=Mariniphaga anaerophila TaxID=1484053 RepID=A0A1M5A7G8_9BACT|nr:class I SAM-dependent methyltransferase [Mariniphaga anaerophila]SHF25782.1 Methyltransferase domain-containing protein [Mariniphaga anaerophila]
MNNFWNERYAFNEYAYGTNPNLFFKEQLDKLKPGKILFAAEGEGRNAVYAAKNGWNVSAFDASTEAQNKANKLAGQNHVSIDYRANDLEHITYQQEKFDAIVLIFAHFHPRKRESYHKKLISFLKPGGTVILESFSKNQINYKSGGPRNVEMLYSEEELKSDFGELAEIYIKKNRNYSRRR